MAGPLRIGVVGAGSIGIRGTLQHLAIRDFDEQVVLQAICDPAPGRAEAAAERYGAPQWFTDYEALLEQGDVEIVTLCTPIGLHFEQGRQAIAAGRHVHFNKTMTTTRAEADELIALAEERGVRLVASPGQMLRPHLQRIRELVQGGELGRLAWAATGAAFGSYHEQEGVRQGHDALSNINPAWYWRKPGGGPLYDMTVYGLHALTGVLGSVRRVTALSGKVVEAREFRGQIYPSDCDDNTLMLLDFGSAQFAFVYGTPAGNVVHSFGSPSFFGTAGSIIGEQWNGRQLEYPGWEIAAKLGGNAILPHYNEQHPTEEFHVFEDILQLVRWVREGVPTVSTAEHARHVIEIIEGAFDAAETGQAVELTTRF